MFFQRYGSLFIGTFRTLIPYTGLVHGVSTRSGGVSGRACSSLNLGNPAHDRAANIAENRTRFFAALGQSRDRAVFPVQVHGTGISAVDAPGACPETDAVMTATRGICLSVQTADCLPVMLYDPKTPAAAVVHAGWRGCRDGIIGMAVIRMGQEYGSDPRDVRACIGPAIGPCCYRVGPEFRQYFPARFFVNDRLDLTAAALQQLRDAGLDTDKIEASGFCTSCLSRYFYSYRRDGEGTGRMMSVMILQ